MWWRRCIDSRPNNRFDTPADAFADTRANSHTNPVASVGFTTTSTGTPLTGTIADPDGKGTIASLVIDGDETIAVSGGATYGPTNSNTSFFTTTRTYTAAPSDARLYQ
ncbi:hypothetical protein [uncultured Sphingomonas sp.]|uniref:hypothetical protein n=1 Tax=uncultured Sphingomonas sp. TaxID=158754 RepID=UPI0035C9EDDF